jgi:hypothetical protein
MPDVDPALCPRCNSRNTEQMTSKNKLGLPLHRCTGPKFLADMPSFVTSLADWHSPCTRH